MPGEFNRIAAIEVFSKLGEGIGTMRPEEENAIDKILLNSGMDEVLLKEAHIQVGIGKGQFP